MRAGDLDRRITIQRAAVSHDEFNGAVETWQNLGTVAAERRDMTNREMMAAQQIGAALQSHFTVRSSALTRTITPKDRLSYDGAVWNIEGVREMPGKDWYLTITATRRADG
jgi:SPP1 family predicted phage head-tail adaptor